MLIHSDDELLGAGFLDDRGDLDRNDPIGGIALPVRLLLFRLRRPGRVDGTTGKAIAARLARRPGNLPQAPSGSAALPAVDDALGPGRSSLGAIDRLARADISDATTTAGRKSHKLKVAFCHAGKIN